MKVVAKKVITFSDYITEGKVYDVFRFSVDSFEIIDDVGDIICCSFRGCDHIEGNWTIIGNRAVVAEENE